MKVLVVVDMQNDFIDGALGTKEATLIVPAVIDKIESYIRSGDLGIYTKDTHPENYLETSEGKKLPVPHCIKGTHGHDIPDTILRPGYPIFEKKTFGSVELVRYLKTLDLTSVELVGLCTDICVISNALLIKANFPEIPILVDAAACAGVTPTSHSEALNTMRLCQIDVV